MRIIASRRGFSLIELSIVLVILGLLAGGVLSGQTLIRAAELRRVGNEYTNFTSAVNGFRDKYFGLPGDLSNATQFWGKNVTYCNAHTGIAATNGTCNGNGDGIIDNSTAASTTAERFQIWNQLAQAGLIEGSYTGITGPGGARDTQLGINAPASRMPNAGWSAFVPAGDGSSYMITYSNVFQFGANSGSTPNSPNAPVLKPEEAWNLDTKLDDGKPATGKIIARYWNNSCSGADDGSSANDDLVASYRLGDSSARCAFYFLWQ